MSLTKENNKITDHFYTLRSEIDVLINKVKSGEHSYYQNYLYFTYAPVSSYTDAVIILCSKQKYNAAHNILRSLFEVHINIVYHGTGNKEKKLAVSAKKQFVEQRKALNGIRGITEKYESHRSDKEGDLFNPEYLAQMLEECNSRIQSVVDGNNLTDQDEDPKLIAKAIACDGEDVKGAKEGHFELMYHLPYRLLSSYVHLDIQGLDSFVKKKGENGYSFIETASENMLICQAISVYVAIVKDLYDYKVLTGDKPKLLGTVDEETKSHESNKSV